jgi:hypothetical protein
MIVLLDGTDGVGKTTYGRWLAERTGGVLLHWGPPVAGEHWVDAYVAPVARWVRDEVVVADRGWPGSRVWARMGFHEPTTTEEDWRTLCRWHAKHRATYTLIVRPVEHIEATLAGRGEDPGARATSITAQSVFIDMVLAGEVLYMPVALATSDLIHHTRTENDHA